MVDISDINTIAVIGAGLMGYGIAQVALMAGFKNVILNDISEEAIQMGASNIEKSLKTLEQENKLSEGLSTAVLMSRLTKERDLKKAVENTDMVIEAIPEIMNLKQGLFEKLGQYAPDHTIFATNTSTMSISEIGKNSGRLDKMVGMHFFIPLRMRLIEVIKGKQTSDETLDICAEVGKRLPCIRGSRVVITIEKESPGFIVNRLSVTSNMYLDWLLDEASEKNITPEQLDADMGDFLPMGLFEIMDQLGLDIIYHCAKYFEDVVHPDFAPGKVLTKLVEEGKLGKKSGQGLYMYSEGKIIKHKGIKPAGMLEIDALLAIHLNEGCRLLDEGIVSGYKQIDDAMINGLGTPGPFGPGKRKYKEWVELLELLAEKTGKSYFKPCELMKSGGFLKMRK